MNVEFVSVNPTGPLHVGHARYASYGDALCRIFAFVGHDVTREFYVNDYGTQMVKFGQSLAARYGQRLGSTCRCPRTATRASTCSSSPTASLAEAGDALSRRRWRRPRPTPPPCRARSSTTSRSWGRDAILALFRATLERLRVPFDVWTSEATLYEGDGRASRLRRRGRQGAGRAGRRGRTSTRGGRRLAAHHRVRRRQGPRAHPPDRRAHLLPLATSPTTATRWTAASST